MDSSTVLSLMKQAGMQRIRDTAEGFAAICPIHMGNNPTFNINTENGMWRCWNPQCDQRGNFAMFLYRICKMDYNEAIEYADSMPEIASSTPDEWKLPAYDSRFTVPDDQVIDEAVLGLYTKCPRHMLDRGFSLDFLRRYDIGFASDDVEWPAGSGKLLGKNRVTFPIRDARGRLIGFTRRSVDDSWPKYLHFVDRSVALYLVDRITGPGPILLTEGPVDALRPRFIYEQLPIEIIGEFTPFSRAVASLGALLTDAQADLISKLTDDVVIGYDNDDPGRSGTKRAIRMLREKGCTKIRVATFPGHDLGGLDVASHVDVDFVPSFQWLSSH
jgi:DNA primase